MMSSEQMIDQLLEFDTSLFLYLNSLGSEFWDPLWLLITHKLTFVPLYCLLLYWMYKQINTKSFLFLLGIIILMILFTDQVTNLFKDGFQRLRPCREPLIEDLVRAVARCGKYGFFSGHSSNSMATAIFTGLMLRQSRKHLIWFMILWSCIVAYSRIYVGVHYPLDVLCGLFFGMFSGYLFYQLFKKLSRRFNDV